MTQELQRTVVFLELAILGGELGIILGDLIVYLIRGRGITNLIPFIERLL